MPKPPPPPSPNRFFYPVLFGVGYIAAVIAAFGVTSLALGVDPIEEFDAGVLLGPTMVLAATVVTFIAMVKSTVRTSPLLPTIAAVGLSYVAMLLVGGLGYAYGRGQGIWIMLFTARQAASPFILGAAALSGIVVLLCWLSVRAGAANPDGTRTR